MYHNPDIYTVALKDGSIGEYTSDIFSVVPLNSSSSNASLLPSWTKGGANATLFLTHMGKPKHGTLDISEIRSGSFILESLPMVLCYMTWWLIINICLILDNDFVAIQNLKMSMMHAIE
jgi:hypothetical protein